jgi:hypothetical protein
MIDRIYLDAWSHLKSVISMGVDSHAVSTVQPGTGSAKAMPHDILPRFRSDSTPRHIVERPPVDLQIAGTAANLAGKESERA